MKNLIIIAFAALLLVTCSDSSDNTLELANPQEYLNRPLAEQVAAIEDGALDCRGLVDGYLDRINASESDANGINAFISLIDTPKEVLSEVEQSRGSGLSLQCAVIAIKDNSDMAGLPTTAGSLALENNFTEQDATLVAKLRAKGAILIGKTNLDEWAAFRGLSPVWGWSSLGGQTKNGANSGYSPCGSSAGSAAAVAAGLVPAAIVKDCLTAASSTGLCGLAQWKVVAV